MKAYIHKEYLNLFKAHKNVITFVGIEPTVETVPINIFTDQELEDIKLAAINEYLSALPEEQKPMIDRVSYYRGREDGKANAEIEKEQVARDAWFAGAMIDKKETTFQDYWKEKNK